MSLMWIPLITSTVFLFGIGQVLTKKGTTRLGSPGMLFLLSINMVLIYGGAWLFFHEGDFPDFRGVTYAAIATFLSALGYIFFYEAVERQKISIVGVITAAYPFITVILAVTFLHEPLTLGQVVGVVLIIGSVSLLSHTRREKGNYDSRKQTWLLLAVLCFVIWGIWAAAAKFAIDMVGYITYAGIYSIVGPLTWIFYWHVRSGTFHLTREDVQAELSVIFFCFGGLTFYAALNYGLASIVTPFSNLYPFITLVFARILLSERLEKHRLIAVTLALSGILILTF